MEENKNLKQKSTKNTTNNQEKVKNNFPNVKKEDKSKKQTISKKTTSHSKGMKAAVITLAITTGVLGLSTIGFAAWSGVAQNKVEDYSNRLEAVYQKSFYDLVDNVNNAEINMSKVLASNTASYQKKMLSQVADNATNAQASFSSLPLTYSSLNDSLGLLNQIGGYTKTLNEKLASGEELSSSEIETLDKLHSVLLEIKAQLNKLSIKMRQGYNILDNSLNLDTGNNFTLDLSKIKTVDVEYPSMIYDGPFSDSVTNVAVKGLHGNKVSKEESKDKIAKLFKNIVSLEFEQDTQGRFETYNYRLRTSDNTTLYVQTTQIGGHVLTVSGVSGNNGEVAIEGDDAQKMAVEFAKANGIENPLVVWTDTIDSQAYFNIAPTQNGVVLYPDLVKVKIDLNNGTVIGYDATSYFTNHTTRQLESATYSQDKSRTRIPENFVIKSERIVLAPLDYNREVLCYEFACDNDNNEYYFYINAKTGQDENILRVIQTENGNKLM